MLGVGALTTSLLHASSLFAEGNMVDSNDYVYVIEALSNFKSS